MIIVRNYSGIGNIIKNIVSALMKAKLTKDGVILQCDLHGHLHVSLPSGHSGLKTVIYNTWKLEYPEAHWPKETLIKPSIFWLVGSISRKTAYWGLDYQYNNLAPNVLRDFNPIFARFEFSDSLLRKVEKIVAEHDISSCVGVHIRTWTDDQARESALFNIKLYTEIIDGLDARIYLATDSYDCQLKMKRRYGNRVIVAGSAKERHIAKRPGVDTLELALIDALVLSRCHSLVGSYQSTFTELAWWLGGARQQVYVPTPPVFLVQS